MNVIVKVDPGLLDGLDAYRQQQGESAFDRQAAVNTIVRDWLQGQGFVAIPGDRKHKTAAKAAGVPTWHLDP